MPLNSEGGHKNLTLRLPDEYHRQIVKQAERFGLTLNAHLNNIVRRHLMESGYYPDVLKSSSGRLFEIEVAEIPRSKHSGTYFCSRFDIVEHHPLYDKRRAFYVFGVESSLIHKSDPFGAVKDIGIALLNFYNREGLEIDQLAWQEDLRGPSSPNPEIPDNWRYIGPETTRTVEEFMVTLGRNHWSDPLLQVTGLSQDLRYGRRTERDLYRTVIVQKEANFEGHGYDSAENWLRTHGQDELSEEFTMSEYEDLPRYIQEQINPDKYFQIVSRCLNQLKKKAI